MRGAAVEYEVRHEIDVIEYIVRGVIYAETHLLTRLGNDVTISQ